MVGILLLGTATGCTRPKAEKLPTASPEVLSGDLRQASKIPSPRAQRCAECHREIFDAWLSSQHAWANRLIDPAQDEPAFAADLSLTVGSSLAEAKRTGSQFLLTWKDPAGNKTEFTPQAVIGVSPLRQYLVPFPGGRWQVFPLAWDPATREWFHVFGEEDREPREWGHWSNRGNNWNSQCASCHMTGFEKNYEARTDSYRSRWEEMGVACSQCHGEKDDHPKNTKTVRGNAQDTCASCHARREELTGQFKPGDSFNDHFRLLLADQEGLYYPDGQVRQEDFEYGSFMMSRMGFKGVTCLDCHNPHSGKLLQPVADNSLCLSCHQAPGRRGAIPVEPLAHSHHPAGSRGNLCIECHMPATKFMMRDPRRDHGFTVPDPLLTQELGVPNACNRCHSDRSAEWAQAWTKKWFGPKLDRPSRQRARVIARAQRRDPSVVPELLSLLQQEENPAWVASMVALLSPWAAEPKVRAALQASLNSESPWVRSAAIHALGATPDTSEVMQALQTDPSRLVRVDALWASAVQGKSPKQGLPELLRYLEYHADQPPGALKQAQFFLAQGEKERAEAWIRKAADWDRSSAYAQFMKGRVLNLLGKNDEAAEAFQEARRLEPNNADYSYSLALLYSELNRGREALALLLKTVELDPAFGRAWYNLGLAYAQGNQFEASLQALEKAEALMEDSAEPPYAMATLYLRRGESEKARRALARALQRNPQFAPAQDLLSRLPAKE
ncbi:MAG: tetratricopeptide repeat protein [bacterium]